MTKVDSIKEKIIEILRQDTRGLTIQELSEQLKVTRVTASIALAKLEGAGMITVRTIGNCKLHYLNQNSANQPSSNSHQSNQAAAKENILKEKHTK